MPVSRAQVLCFSAGLALLVLYPIVLPGHAKFEPCKPEQVEVDLEGHLTVHYSLCDDPGSVCFQQQNESCEPEQELELITKAKLVDTSDNSHQGLKLHNDRKGFDVLLPVDGELFTGPGIYHYKVMYEYETLCANPLNRRDCTGWVRDLRLSVTVVDFKLGLLSSNGVDILETSSTDIDEMQVQSVERNVSLLCSSGLSDEFSSLNIPAAFFFYPKHDTDDYNVSSICDSSNTVSVNNGNLKWIITRQQSPPHDCVLTIVGFGGHNVGRYRCTGVLSQSNSPSLPVEDWSNNLRLKLPTKLQSASVSNLSSLAELWVTVFFGVVVAATIAIFLAFVALVVGYLTYRKYRSTRQPIIQVLPRFQGYGSTSTVNDLSRPHTPNPTSADESQQLVVYSDYDPNSGVSEIESSIDERRPPSRARQRPKRRVQVEVSESDYDPNQQSEPPLEELHFSESPSSELQPSVGQEGVNAYMEHMHIQPAEGETPKDSTAPPNPNYKCPNCHKTYKDDQRLFWKRHWNERDKRCIPCSQESAAFGTGIANTAKPSERESETFQSEEPNGAGAVQVDSFAGSIKSVGEQGRKIYDQIMALQPAIGETPTDSIAPLNPNYRCPNCKRIYHNDQRTFYARHWNEREKRCVACTQNHPSITITHEDTTDPLSSANTPAGDLSTQPAIRCVTPPTPVAQVLPTATATAAGSGVDQKDLNFMSESDQSCPPSSQSASYLDSMNN